MLRRATGKTLQQPPSPDGGGCIEPTDWRPLLRYGQVNSIPQLEGKKRRFVPTVPASIESGTQPDRDTEEENSV